MQHHGVLDGVVGEDVAGEDLAVFQVEQRVGRCAGEVSAKIAPVRRRAEACQTEGLPRPSGLVPAVPRNGVAAGDVQAR